MLFYPDSFICPRKSEFCLLTTCRKIHSAPSRVLATAVDFGVTGNLKIHSLNSDWRGQRENLQLWSTKNSTYSLGWPSFFFMWKTWRYWWRLPWMPAVLHRARLSSPISFTWAIELPKAGIVETSLMDVWSCWGMLYATSVAKYKGATFFL